MPNREILEKDFSAGWVTNYPPLLIPEGAASDVQNVDFSDSIGVIRKRRGISIEYTEKTVAANPYVCGMTQYIQADADEFIVAAANDDVYNVTAPGTWTSIHTNASLNGAQVNFATFDDLLVFVSANLTTQKWTGSGSSSDLLGTPPSNAQYIEVHRGRLWIANTSAGKSRLNGSAANNAEDWTTSNDAYSTDINPDDGDQITGLASVGDALLIFKNRSTYALYGNKPDNFTVQRLSASIGCIAPRSIVKTDSFAIFLSDRGVYAASTGGIILMSYNIRPTVEALSYSVKQAASAGRYKNQYWVAYDSDADSKNDTALVLDYVHGIWSKYSNIKASQFITLANGVLLSGGSDIVIIREHESGTEDESTAVTMTWEGRDLDYGNFTQDKQFFDIFVAAEGVSGKALTVRHLIDGALQSETPTMDLTPSGSNTYVYDSLNGLQASQGRFLRVRFTNAEAAATVKIYAYSLLAGVRERQD